MKGKVIHYMIILIGIIRIIKILYFIEYKT